MPTQAMVRRAVHAPSTQNVSGCRGTQFHPQDALLHAVVHLGDLWSRLIRVRHQLQLDDPSPLNVLVVSLVRRYRQSLEHDRVLDTGYDEIPELLRFTVEGTYESPRVSWRPFRLSQAAMA